MILTLQHLTGEKKGSADTRTGILFNLGAKPDNDVVFSGFPGHVAGYHAQIRESDGAVILQDMGSAGGTFCNGERMTRTTIQPGDRVRLGDAGPEFVAIFDPATVGRTAADGQKLYGQRTVGLMIAQALRSAGVLKTGVSRSTAYFEAVLEKKLRITARRWRMVLLIALPLVALLAVAISVIAVHMEPAVVPVSAQSGAGSPVAAQHRANVFLLVGLPSGAPDDSDDWTGFCTAFAISANLLATNAHCAVEAGKKYRRVLALMNENPEGRYEVVRQMIHPDYQPDGLFPDVALLQIRGTLRRFVKMADRRALEAVAAGTTVFMYGFPGTLANPAEPVATFTRGEIGRVTTLSFGVGDFRDNVLLQHSAVTSRGTSGSPLFDENGLVIGINAGGYEAAGAPQAGYNYAMRIDLLAGLIRDIAKDPE